MRPTRTLILVRSVFALYLGIELAALALTIHILVAHPGSPIYDYYLEALIAGVFLLALTLLMVVRRPDHPVTWAFLLLCVTGSLQALLGTYAVEALIASPGQLPFGELALAGSSIAQTWFVLSGVLLIGLFPTGTTLGGWWRALPILIALNAAVFPLMALTQPTELGNEEVPALIDGTLPSLVGFLDGALVFLIVVGTIAQVIVRYVKSSGIEREQLKWLVFSFVVGLVVVIGPWAEDDTIGAILWTLVPASILGAMALAILRYRLYEIDRVISRTVTYSLVVGMLAAAVAGLAALIGSRFQEPMIVAATTLAVAAIFNPLRMRVQALVDRRFNRSLFDSGRVMDEFAATLRNRVDPTDVVEGWTGVVRETMQPAVLGVWLRS